MGVSFKMVMPVDKESLFWRKPATQLRLQHMMAWAILPSALALVVTSDHSVPERLVIGVILLGVLSHHAWTLFKVYKPAIKDRSVIAITAQAAPLVNFFVFLALLPPGVISHGKSLGVLYLLCMCGLGVLSANYIYKRFKDNALSSMLGI